MTTRSSNLNFGAVVLEKRGFEQVRLELTEVVTLQAPYGVFSSCG